MNDGYSLSELWFLMVKFRICFFLSTTVVFRWGVAQIWKEGVWAGEKAGKVAPS